MIIFNKKKGKIEILKRNALRMMNKLKNKKQTNKEKMYCRREYYP